MRVHVFVATRGDRDIGFEVSTLTLPNGRLSEAEYRRRMITQNGSGVNVETVRSNGRGGCLLVYRHEKYRPGQIMVSAENSRINAVGQARRITTNGGTVESTTCEPGV